jgi:hypothetical protein
VSSKQSNFFSVRTETQSVSIVFWFILRNQKTFFFGLFWCFGPVSKQPKQTEFSQNKPKQTKKNLQKTFSIRGSSKSLIYFLGSNRNKPKLNLFWLFFGLLFRETKQIFSGLFQFVLMFRTRIETTETNGSYGMGN